MVLLRVLGVGLSGLMLLQTGAAGRERFANYKSVEVYEARPGVLALPRYAADGELCEVALQRRLFTPGHVRLDVGLIADTDIDPIFAELAPVNSRGAELFHRIEFAGKIPDDEREYENVTVHVYTITLAPDRGRPLAAVAKLVWKKRTCAAGVAGHAQLARYKAVDAFAVRPELLSIPRYASSGKLCGFGMERLLTASLSPNLTAKEVGAVVEELVPEQERGKLLSDANGDPPTPMGISYQRSTRYENIVLRTYGVYLSTADPNAPPVEDDLMAAVSWWRETCQ